MSFASRFRSTPPWILVFTGLILNVLAIMITSVVLDEMSAELAALNEQKADNIYSIQLTWNQIESIERKRDMLLLHSHLKTEFSPLIAQELQSDLNNWTGKTIPSITEQTFPQVLDILSTTQQSLRERIDTFYLDNITATEVIQHQSERMAFYKSIALFLQIFGLALILARDLARK
ncbi:DNA mismatch repair protein [Vibrio maerlii]|uniref:DNA mismatch repair protein n=1 Tax=Vibrio maerlii TaxID=2231648 RepID=UPI000E3C05B4|nr:DNA mismatch repair protein [Vibrio maerlii]